MIPHGSSSTTRSAGVINAPTRDAFKFSAPPARTYKADPKFGLMRLERLKEFPRRFRFCERKRTPSKHLLRLLGINRGAESSRTAIASLERMRTRARGEWQETRQSWRALPAPGCGHGADTYIGLPRDAGGLDSGMMESLLFSASSLVGCILLSLSGHLSDATSKPRVGESPTLAGLLRLSERQT